MLTLSQQQRLLLYEFIVDGERRTRQMNASLQQTLGYIMSSIDVRKTDLIEDESTRFLVGSSFQLVKYEYLLENGLIASASYKKTVRDIQAKALQHNPDVRASPV